MYLNRANYELDAHGKRCSTAERRVDTITEGVNITHQPCNRFYYEHIINPDEATNELSTSNDLHVRNQLLVQYKYDTEKSKTTTFFLITVLSYVIVLPMFVIHFTRTYRNIDANATVYDGAVNRGVYTAFVWIAYTLLIIKSFLCLVQNRFYRHQLYKSANCRGFTGIYDFQHEIKMLVRKLDSAIDSNKNTKDKVKTKNKNNNESEN